MLVTFVIALKLFAGSLAALPPGPGPFPGEPIIPQPVPGAPRAHSSWMTGKICNLMYPPYSAKNGSNATVLIQQAIDDCGDRSEGGTVRIPAELTLLTASLWLRSNLTFRVEGKLVGTATGSTKTPQSIKDAPITYTRRNSLMVDAHAGLINGGRCVRKKDPLVGWDDCAEWTKLENVVIEGGGILDANADDWYKVYALHNDPNTRPMMLDLLWINGLTIRDMQIYRPGYWTVHPTFSNNVRITNNTIITTGSNTDGCDPDSCWNVYIGSNTFSTGDDCIAIKAGRDWSGLMVNISTQNVLAEDNYFMKGHGVSIGSETSGWVRNVTIRNSVLNGTNLAVRIKSMRGRGGGVEDVLYENLEGDVVSAIQLTLNYHTVPPTNATATPVMRRITVRDMHVKAKSSDLTCDGLNDSEIHDVVFTNVTITGSSKQDCSSCSITSHDSRPKPKC